MAGQQQQHHHHHQRTRQLNTARFVASIAATTVALACGTNFADRLRLSSTQSNLIGLSGNLGMYSLGVPVGIVIDHRGPRPFVLSGSALLFAGYFSLHRAYDRASGSVFVLCFFSFLTGLGGCMAFAAAVKTSALNWPRHRGTATAFPLAAFGLSAFVFSCVGALFFPGDPSAFLKLLSCGTFALTFSGFFFLKVYPNPPGVAYAALPRTVDNAHSATAPRSDPSRRLAPHEPKHSRRAQDLSYPVEPGTSSRTPDPRVDTVVEPQPPRDTFSGPSAAAVAATDDVEAAPRNDGDLETTSLLSSSSLPSPSVSSSSSSSSPSSSSPYFSSPLSPPPSASEADSSVSTGIDQDRSRRLDLRGFRLLRTPTFWLFFSIMAVLGGIGLMTINNLGNDVNALWKHHDKSVGQEYLLRRQQINVSILSLCSFAGRLLSGIGSDFLVKVLRASRLWCLFVASLLFLIAQVSALTISDPHFLGLLSSLTGIAYGFLFGVFPSLVAEAFGIRGLSQNWGFMSLAPVVTSNTFNLLYGAVFDAHSVIEADGKRSCYEGSGCYRSAYWITLGAGFAGLLVTLSTIRHERAVLAKESRCLR